jgi:predicted RNase H-like HicB family nuclease
MQVMSLHFHMQYWKDGDWFVGRLPQVPGVFSQGATLAELEENIRDAYQLMLEEQGTAPLPVHVETKEIEVPA